MELNDLCQIDLLSTMLHSLELYSTKKIIFVHPTVVKIYQLFIMASSLLCPADVFTCLVTYCQAVSD